MKRTRKRQRILLALFGIPLSNHFTFEKFLQLLVKAPLNHFIHREIQYQHKNETI